MANNIALAKTFVPILDEIYKLASLTSKLDGAAELARQGANANELIVPMLSMQGLGDYSRNDGYVNRRWWIDLSANDSPQWAEVSVGITSRGNSINEQSQEYYDMAGRGVAESEVTGVSVSRTFTGFRRFGDAAQDAIMDRLYDLDNRKVKFIECYDNLGSGKPNGRQGEGVLSITDDGSGDAQNRENISFGLKILGTPQKGTVTIGEDGTPTFSPQAAEAKAASK